MFGRVLISIDTLPKNLMKIGGAIYFNFSTYTDHEKYANVSSYDQLLNLYTKL